MKKIVAIILIVAIVCINSAGLIGAVETGVCEQKKTRAQLLDDLIQTAMDDIDNIDEWTLKEDEGRKIDVSREVNAARDIGDVYTIKGTAPNYVETAAGAHYYAQTPHTNNYDYVAGFFELPTDLRTEFDTELNDKNRTAYISVGFVGASHSVDVGIRNKEGNWHPYYYDGYPNLPDTPPSEWKGTYKAFDSTVENGKYVADSTAVCAAFFLKPYTKDTGEDVLICYITFYDSEDNVVANFNKALPIEEGNLLYVDDQLSGRFYRFVSLVQPDGTIDNQQDGTYMLNAGFSDLRIDPYDDSVEEWGITTDTVENVWLVSPERIQLEYGSNYENSSIEHWAM